MPCAPCCSLRYQTRMLDLANKMDNMFKAVSVEADSNTKGARKPAGKKRPRDGGSFSSV